jgi:hypothetical protein
LKDIGECFSLNRLSRRRDDLDPSDCAWIWPWHMPWFAAGETDPGKGENRDGDNDRRYDFD